MTGTLSHSPAEILYQYLLDAEVIGPHDDENWPSFINNNPPDVDSFIVVRDTAGRTQGKVHVTMETVMKDGVQIVVTSDQLSSFRKTDEIKEALEIIFRELVTIDSISYIIQAATLTSTIIAMGKDLPEANTFSHSINAIVSVRRNST